MRFTVAFLFLLLFPMLSLADGMSEVDQPDKSLLIEITDKYDEVTLGLTDSKVYMIISEEKRNFINRSLKKAFQADFESFNDSNGSFIMGTYEPLDNTVIEYHIHDINNIIFENGELYFDYNTKYSVIFEDVMATNGKPALSNFKEDDILNFISQFKKI